MSKWTSPITLIPIVLLIVTGCVGRDFVRPESDTLVLNKTTYREVRDRFGSPFREGSVLKNGVTLKTLSYAYSSGGASLVGGVTPSRGIGLYFMDDRLVGHEFTSSYAADHTDFDDTKIGTIKKRETTRAQVVELLGRPGGVYTHPLIKDKDDEALV